MHTNSTNQHSCSSSHYTIIIIIIIIINYNNKDNKATVQIDIYYNRYI